MAAIPNIFSRIGSMFGNKTKKANGFGINEGIDKVQYILQKYNKYKDHFEEERDRENNDWKMYTGFDHGQWDSESAQTLLDEGRHLGQYNFIRGKVDSIAGSLLRNWYDVDFVPTDGGVVTATQLLKDLYYADKELMNWDLSYCKFVVDFLIHGGTEELFISDRFSPLGNIAFERMTPGHILFDPNWTTESGWDLKEAFKIAYMSAEEIMTKFPNAKEDIRAYTEAIRAEGPSFDNSDYENGNIPNQDLNTSYGSNYRVIENHYIKEEIETREVVLNSQGELVEVPVGEDEEKRQWAIKNQIDFSIGVIEKKVPVSKYYRCTICPDLTVKPLEEILPLIQIGRLPFFHASSHRVNGRDSGIVEILTDIQQTINKRESLIDHMIANSASGAMIIDPEIFGNDVSKLEDLKANMNNPTFKEFSKPGEIASGRKHIEEIPRAQFPSDVLQEINRMWDMGDRISKSPPVMDGRSEGSEDRSGSLYARKQQQAEINTTTMLKSLEYHWNEKGEAWMLVAQALYGGVEREFRGAGKTGGTISINQEVETPNGSYKYNDISTIPRHKVIVSQSPQGVTYREVQRTINSELLKYIPPTNPISRATIVKNIMKSIDAPEEERKDYAEAYELERILAVESTKAQISGLVSQRMQAEAQLNQMTNSQQVGAGGEKVDQEQPIQSTKDMQPQEPTTPIG